MLGGDNGGWRQSSDEGMVKMEAQKLFKKINLRLIKKIDEKRR